MESSPRPERSRAAAQSKDRVRGPAAPLARRLAEFAAGLPVTAIPPAVVAAAKDHLLDALGVGLAAAALTQRPPILDAVRALGRGEEATGLGLADPLPAPSAALLNGTLIHALEFDDTHIASVVHGSTIVVPAALAMAEREKAGGGQLLRAIVLGWEAFTRLGLAAPGALQPHGFQITAVGGPFAAALAAAALAGLDASRTAAALGIAGSQAAGVFEFLENGSTAKHLHGGWPAHAGLVAAELARAGMTGPETIFEGRFGFYRAYARAPEGGERLGILLDDLGERWYLPEAAFKPYPCCHYIQPFIECLEAVLARGVAASAIAEIRCAVPAEEAALIAEPSEAKLSPATPYQAKWSLPYCLAARLLDGRLDVATFDRPAPDPRVSAAARMVRCEAVSGMGFPSRYAARIEIVLADGRHHVAAVDDVRGGPSRPLGKAEVERKFMENAGRRLTKEGVAGVLREVERLDAAPDLAGLSRALRRLR